MEIYKLGQILSSLAGKAWTIERRMVSVVEVTNLLEIVIPHNLSSSVIIFSLRFGMDTLHQQSYSRWVGLGLDD